LTEKLVSFNREDFTEDAWDILCSEFECYTDTDTIMRLVMLDENEDELGLYNDNDEDDFEEDEE
jgi:hypothetical protein